MARLLQSMENPAPADYPLHSLIERRWSPRAFSSHPVEREKLCSLLEAARWAPSGYNGQPWFFLIATQDEPEDFQRLLAALVPQNQVWAGKAPVLMAAVARSVSEPDGKPNRHAWYEAGQAVANLTLQATSMGLLVHQMGGFDPEKVKQGHGLPEGFDAVAAIALGYPGNPDDLPDDLRKREYAPRTRRPLSESVFTGAWSRSPAWLAPSS